jgi:hypothetical protein
MEHIRHFHGAELKVLLVLGRHRAAEGTTNPSPTPSPRSWKTPASATRAISQAISRLDKHHLILRVKKHGALPNRYRVLLEPAARPYL